jgi:hypothetical protein
LPLVANGAELQFVMGAGPSTKVVTLFFKHFSEQDAASSYDFVVVPRSIKHAGGIRAAEKYLFGRTGRPLSNAEKHNNKEDIFLASNPLAIVVGRAVGVKQLSVEQLEEIFARRITNWRQLGGEDKAIVLVGREATEASLGILVRDYPSFSTVKFDRVFSRDHQVVNFIHSPEGGDAISFGAKANFEPEDILEIEGFQSQVNLGLVYDKANETHAVISAVKEYAASQEWRTILTRTGFFPVH